MWKSGSYAAEFQCLWRKKMQLPTVRAGVSKHAFSLPRYNQSFLSHYNKMFLNKAPPNMRKLESKTIGECWCLGHTKACTSFFCWAPVGAARMGWLLIMQHFWWTDKHLLRNTSRYPDKDKNAKTNNEMPWNGPCAIAFRYLVIIIARQ